MATLDQLKRALKDKAEAIVSSGRQPLPDSLYGDGFDKLIQSSGRTAYEDFIVPELTHLLAPLFKSRSHVSVLEVGPGPRSVLGSLPESLKTQIKRYTAFEPNHLFAAQLEESLCGYSEVEWQLPCLESRPDIHRIPFDPYKNTGIYTRDGAEGYDLVLFCHSMYGMKPKRKFIERAIELLSHQLEGGLVVLFHRDNNLHLDGLICHRAATFPTGVVRVEDDDYVLGLISTFIAGFTEQRAKEDETLRTEWRKVCRDLGGREEAHPGHLLFRAPELMLAFTRHATKLPELTARVPLAIDDRKLKSWEARSNRRSASIVKPTEIRHVQECVWWALKYGFSLTVVGGSHGGHCLRPNTVAVDMSAFDKIHVSPMDRLEGPPGADSVRLVIAETGSTAGDILERTTLAGLAVPLGSRPSVGAGLWLQGGIGHQSRDHGLTCDAIVGAVVVSVESGQVLWLGHMPSQYRPADAVRPANEADLLWALKGAGTNFGVVISVAFKACQAPLYSVWHRVLTLDSKLEAPAELREFDNSVARKLPRSSSADVYMYYENGQLQLGVATVTHPTEPAVHPWLCKATDKVLGPEGVVKTVYGSEIFDIDMYMSSMYGGHVSGKTSSFKRCVFLKNIGNPDVAAALVAALESRPLPFCYLHLLQGGGAIAHPAADATAFGCRDWDFACVITGIWPREQDETEAALATVEWVYSVCGSLMQLSDCAGVYGADLGPDPRDAALAAEAFGPNRPRLARLKRIADPNNVLAHACPLWETRVDALQLLIILVTGESCAGKDYCADIWVSAFNNQTSLTARAISISHATKREYAATVGIEFDRLLHDRPFKEQHRPALTAFFQNQVRKRPQLLEEHFQSVVRDNHDVNVLFITGMRDEAPVATLGHLVPGIRLLELRVEASDEARLVRREGQGSNVHASSNSNDNHSNITPPVASYQPADLVFVNNATGREAAERFVEQHLFPLVHTDLTRLATMVRSVPNFPSQGITFRHVLGISQRPGGLALCTSLLQRHFRGNWAGVDMMACCEAGGFVFASALAAKVDVPLKLIREAGKLPPPTVSATKASSHISAPEHGKQPEQKRMEMDSSFMPRGGASAVVVDDVLATGETLCAVLELLGQVGIRAGNVTVLVVAEFPIHRGRELLRRRGFGSVRVQSLLVFNGA